MEWKEIQSKYPKAFEAFSIWKYVVKNELTPFRYMILTKNIRNLYDFFDENDLFVEPSASAINRWAYDIFKLTENSFICIAHNYSPYLNRVEAETAVFTKAFELLEVNLTKSIADEKIQTK